MILLNKYVVDDKIYQEWIKIKYCIMECKYSIYYICDNDIRNDLFRIKFKNMMKLLDYYIRIEDYYQKIIFDQKL